MASKGTMSVLLEKGAIKDGQQVYLIHKLPHGISPDPQSPRFSGELRVHEGRVVVRWHRDDKEWSLSGSALQVINEARTTERKTAVGPAHWGTKDQSFVEIHRTLSGGSERPKGGPE